MTATDHYETFLSLLAVLAARIAGASAQHRAVDPARGRRRRARPHSRHSADRAVASIRASDRAAAADLFGGRRNELARVPLQPAADRVACVGCVLFTTCAVAAAARYALALPWSIGFLLGAIVSPPDVVAPLALARRLGLPRRLVVVLEGEGLANDATALVLYRFAVAAVSTGAFSFPEAAGTFGAIVIGEIAYGVGVGWVSLRLRDVPFWHAGARVRQLRSRHGGHLERSY